MQLIFNRSSSDTAWDKLSAVNQSDSSISDKKVKTKQRKTVEIVSKTESECLVTISLTGHIKSL